MRFLRWFRHAPAPKDESVLLAREANRLQGLAINWGRIGVTVALVSAVIGAITLAITWPSAEVELVEVEPGDLHLLPAGKLLRGEGKGQIELHVDIENDTTSTAFLAQLLLQYSDKVPPGASCHSELIELTVDDFSVDKSEAMAGGSFVIDFRDDHSGETSFRGDGKYLPSTCSGTPDSVHLMLDISTTIEPGSSGRISLAIPSDIPIKDEERVIHLDSSDRFGLFMVDRENKFNVRVGDCDYFYVICE